VIFDIRYTTEYRYRGPVTDSINALRVRPTTSGTQKRRDFTLATTPDARIYEYDDYFGTTVHEFEVVQPHELLVIDVLAQVETMAHPVRPDPVWDEVALPAYRDAGAEFLFAALPAPADPQVGALANEARADTPLATLLGLAELIPERFAYQPGVTYVGSTVADFLAAGAGVCQDFVHLALLVLRRLGLTARYCSGYLFVSNGSGPESAEVETHAWLEALLPTAGGPGTWVGIDPTNRVLANENHVKIGHGRSYSDVPPIKGMFRGSAGAELTAKVTMTRIG
jgi:transglutaminase-like putative cysteine protease